MVLNVKISNTTLIWASFIIISASFMRSVSNFLIKHIAMTGVSTTLWCVFAIGLTIVFVYILRSRPKVLNLVLFLIVFVLGIYYASGMQIIEERWHIIQFGLLGWLIARDNEGIKSGFGRFMFSIPRHGIPRLPTGEECVRIRPGRATGLRSLRLLPEGSPLLFGLLIASLDELFQFCLPNRTADIRDIVSGTAGSIWGAMLYLVCGNREELH